jgi:hypothetical protein
VVPWLDLVDSLNEIIRREAVYVDCEQVQKEICKIVGVVVRLVLLHPREQRHDDLAEIRLQRRPTEHSVSAVMILVQKKSSQRDMQYDALQKLETPAIVRLARHQPLLYDAQHRRVLVRLDHRRGVAREEGTQQ